MATTDGPYSASGKIDFIQWPRQMKNVKCDVKSYSHYENSQDSICCIEHAIKGNGNAICNIKITPDVRLNPHSYALQIGGQIVYQTKSPELDNIFTLNNPILIQALSYHEVKLLCFFNNPLNKGFPVNFSYDFITYELDYIRKLVQVSHIISLGEDNSGVLRIFGGTGEKAPKSNPFPKVGTTKDFFRDTIKTKN